MNKNAKNRYRQAAARPVDQLSAAVQQDGTGAHAQAARSSRRLDQFGVNICTLKPGAASSQRHWHENEDELVYVLEGEVVLCEDGGETVLRAGEAAAWKAGLPNGHCLVNRSNRDAIFIEIGTRAPAERAYYSDIDMMVVRDEAGARYMKKDGTPY